MNEKEKKLIEAGLKQQARAKRQNEKAKENWDCISCRLPKGTKDRITAAGESVNGLVNRLVLEFLETIEKN